MHVVAWLPESDSSLRMSSLDHLELAPLLHPAVGIIPGYHSHEWWTTCQRWSYGSPAATLWSASEE